RICVCSWHPKIRDTSGWATNHQRSRTDTHSATPKRCHPERSEGSAFALGTPKSAILPGSSQPANDPEPARIPRLQSAVILNAVKDLRLLLIDPFDPTHGDNRQALSRTNRGLSPSRPGL